MCDSIIKKINLDIEFKLVKYYQDIVYSSKEQPIETIREYVINPCMDYMNSKNLFITTQNAFEYIDNNCQVLEYMNNVVNEKVSNTRRSFLRIINDYILIKSLMKIYDLINFELPPPMQIYAGNYCEYFQPDSWNNFCENS